MHAWVEWVDWIQKIWNEHHTVAHVSSVVIAVLVCNFIVVSKLKWLENRVANTKHPWDNAVLLAIGPPLRVLVWWLGFHFVLEITHGFGEERAIKISGSMFPAVLIALTTWFLLRLIKHVEQNLLQPGATKKRLDSSTVYAVGKLVRLILIILASLIVLQTNGVSISGVLAFGGIGGVAIGFASKDLLSNFFGGLTVYMDRPFSIGDWIQSPDREIEGTVENIGWRRTVVRTFDKRLLYIPNSLFTTIIVQNPSRMSNRRIKVTLGVRYEDGDKLPAIIADVKQMLLDHKDIDARQTLMVNFISYGDSTLNFLVYTFTKTVVWTEFNDVQQDVFFRIMKIVGDHGAEFAFPCRTLYMAEDAPQEEPVPGAPTPMPVPEAPASGKGD